MTTIAILINYWPAWLHGACVTVLMALIISLSGLLVGIPLGYFATRSSKAVFAWRMVAFVVSTFPPLVVLFWAHYPLQGMLDVIWSPLWVAIAVLSIINIIIVGNLTTEGMETIPRNQLEAARLLGLTLMLRVTRVVFPLLQRRIGAQLLGVQLVAMQSTFFAAFISVDELFKTAQTVNADAYSPIQVYTLLALLVFLICLPVNYVYWKARLKSKKVELG